VVGRLSGIRTQSGQNKINNELSKIYCLTGKNAGRAPSLRVYRGICLTAEEKAGKTLSQDSRRAPFGTMKTEYTEQNVHNNENT